MKHHSTFYASISSCTPEDHVVFKEGKFAIPDSGVRFLLNCLREPSERLALLHKDSLTYSGADVTGKPHQAPPCNIKLRQMPLSNGAPNLCESFFWRFGLSLAVGDALRFSLSLDAALASGVVPWPFYQVQPFEARPDVLGFEAEPSETEAKPRATSAGDARPAAGLSAETGGDGFAEPHQSTEPFDPQRMQSSQHKSRKGKCVSAAFD